MKRSNKKGFTIVELVIVIAVIAILAAVLVPTFAGIIDKANRSADMQAAVTMNKILATNEALDGKPTTPSEMVAVLEENGYNAAALDAKSKDYEFIWNSEDNCIVLVDGDGVVEDDDLGTLSQTEWLNWEFIGSEKDITAGKQYSVYLNNDYTGTTITNDAGIDVGNNVGVSVLYTGENGADINKAQSVILNTNGATLTVNNSKADVSHYGVADEVNIKAVADASFHLYAEVTTVKISKGNFVPEKTAKVQVLVVTGAASDKVTVQVKSGAEINTLIIDTAKATYAADIKTSLTNVVSADAIKENVSADKINDAIESATAFSGGLGTAKSPYIIANVEDLKEINTYYDKGYNYFKVMDGVKTIDCNGISSINLHGSFNGNGVTFTNLSTYLFKKIGYDKTNEEITLENFTAKISGAESFARQIVNSGTTTFKNINITGTIEGNYNLGSFYQYGTNGYNYTVKFVNCVSSADIICTSTTVGGFIGHAFPGNGFTAYVDIDDDCAYTGTVYSRKGDQGKEIYGMTAGECVLTKNGETYANEKLGDANRVKINTVNPTQTDNGYTVVVADGAKKIVINILPALTAYDDNDVKIPDRAGITGTINFGEKDVTAGDTVDVLGQVTSVKIVNGANANGYSATLVNGVLTIYTNSSANYKTGSVSLQVVQYDSTGKLIATGTVALPAITE